MDQQLGVINTAVVFSSTTNKFFKLWSVALEKKKEEQKRLWMLLIFLWWCSEVRLEHRSYECYSGNTQTETILNLLPQTPLHPFLSMITTRSLISLQAIRTKIAKAIGFSFWPDYDTSSFETLFMLSSPFCSFLLWAISFKDPYSSLIPYLIPLTCFQMPSLLCRCFPIFSDSLDKGWLR